MSATTSSVKWALVTGAGSGIGRAIALNLSAHGLAVLCVGRRERKLLETKSLAAGSARVEPVVADVSTELGRLAVVRAVETLCSGRLRYLVHNAGVVGPLCRTTELQLGDFRSSMQTNVEAPIFLTRDLFVALKAEKGRVLHVSSGCAHKPSDNWLTYCTSKAALLMAYRCMAQEFKGEVLVGSFKPGIVDSEMCAGAWPTLQRRD
jgi:benzil reductase ((S)-benzoin forming)